MCNNAINRKAILFICLLFGVTVLLSACGEEKYVKGTTKLRCDGVYREVRDSEFPAYLRFFADGKTTYCSGIRNLSPEEAYKILDVDVSTGNVDRATSVTISDAVNAAVAGDGSGDSAKSPNIVLKFAIQGGIVTYNGAIGDNTLVFDGHSTLNGNNFKSRFEFIQVND